VDKHSDMQKRPRIRGAVSAGFFECVGSTDDFQNFCCDSALSGTIVLQSQCT